MPAALGRAAGPVLLAACVVLGTACAGAQGPAVAPAGGPDAPHREREGPADVPPVVHRGVRYEALHWGKARGLEQNGGYVVAVDLASGRELWRVRLYRIDYTLDREPDRLDLFIVSMQLAPDGRRLLVSDENGRRFELDLATRRVVERPAPR